MIIRAPKIDSRSIRRHAKQLIRLKRKMDPVRREFKRLKRELISEMQRMDEDSVSTRLGELKLVCGVRETVDVKTLKREHPHIYHQLLKKTPTNSIIFDFDGCEDEEDTD